MPSCSGDSPELAYLSPKVEGWKPYQGTVSDYRLSGKCLFLKVKAPGRADREDYRLYWQGRVKKSLPPQAKATLYTRENLQGKKGKATLWLVFRLAPLNEYADPERGLVLRVAPDVPGLTYKPGRKN